MKESLNKQAGSITYNPENVVKYIKLMEKIDLNKVNGTNVKFK